MNSGVRYVLRMLRGLATGISVEISLYVALFAGFAAWGLSSSIYAGIIVFFALALVLAGTIQWLGEGRKDKS